MTDLSYIENIIDTLKGAFPNIEYKKMFGDYTIYINKKPLITVCDNKAYVKIHDNIIALMSDADVGYPYDGAKLHYELNVDNYGAAVLVLTELEAVTFDKHKKFLHKKA